jgi:hypothetical protein
MSEDYFEERLVKYESDDGKRIGAMAKAINDAIPEETDFAMALAALMHVVLVGLRWHGERTLMAQSLALLDGYHERMRASLQSSDKDTSIQ